ncbi:CRAL TRIO domain protein (macronuclear) [Tetrahymena thermophila SB210]|uniref:CRAL TRIO domain protein n=1 Tax=Tetrahymena thermophila (strain SB210) TaxID=312017 RepID=I7MGV3_TETTS|nr:CRAL TRIO domain protein [Tetrahymena thermophila SB210]EAS02076.2 CRAL TRIO domain protein [Tetrahymena thermophila SB210]|eukprot:XP_001022321.2 CRAL TRIO domain protein [Tetrahymena thermophila SB210]
MSNTNNSLQQSIDPILGFDPWFLKPPKEAMEIKHTDYYIKHNEKKKGNRKVYQKVQYDEFETQHIEILKQEMERQQIQVPPDWKTSDYLKMCYCGRFDLKKDVKAAKDHIEWRNNLTMHTLDDKARELLSKGILYLLGRDENFRPILYLDCTKINLKKDGEETILRSICVFLDMIKKYMFLDYYIENWIMVIDTGGLGLSSLPINGLKLIIGSMSINYCATMEKMYILNPSFMLNTSWNIIKGFIDPESVEKIQFLKPKDYKEMQKRIPIKFLQKKYCGEHPDVTQFWPPLNVFCSEEERQKQIKNQQQKQKDKEAGAAQNSLTKKQTLKEEKNISAQLNEKNRKKTEDSQGIQQSNTNYVNGNSVTAQYMNNQNNQIFNDGIKPKIIITKVKDDVFDSQYAMAGYDEQLENQLRKQAEQRRQEMLEQKKKQMLQKEEEEAANQTGQPGSLKQGVSLNNTISGNGISTNTAATYTAVQGANTTNISNNINFTTEHSEGNQQSNQFQNKGKKNFNSAVPDLDSQQEDSAIFKNNNLTKDQDGDPLIFNHTNIQNNPIIQFEGDDSSNAKCCQNCNIF